MEVGLELLMGVFHLRLQGHVHVMFCLKLWARLWVLVATCTSRQVVLASITQSRVLERRFESNNMKVKNNEELRTYALSDLSSFGAFFVPLVLISKHKAPWEFKADLF